MKKQTIIFLLFIAHLFVACQSGTVTRTDTPTSGTAYISCDECFKPIMQEEIDVFTGLNINAHIIPVYCSENEAFQYILKDSIRAMITARDLTADEKEKIKSLGRTPRSQKIAIDGIALIINKQNPDSLISVSNLQKIMTGEITDWKDITTSKNKASRPMQIVFDNPSSSTVRFIKDTICKGKPMGSRLSAAQSNAAVLEYVAKHPNSLGIIGVNWISNPNDSSKLTFDKTIQVMYVSRDNNPTEDNSYQPVPAYLGLGYYPLIRDVYMIISDVRDGLPSGFVAFVAGDSGQRIILKAGLVPATRPIRYYNMKNDF